MSELIKHECGIAFIRLLKPLSYYHDKYGDVLYGLRKMNILMEKQKNRGQDGAGIATIKLDHPPGKAYIDRKRSLHSDAITYIFKNISQQFSELDRKEFVRMRDPKYAKENYRFLGELILGHLRYATHGDNDFSNLHPRIRANNWITRSLVVAGNYNLTNVNELFDLLIELGQVPREMSDTMTVVEKIGHFLDVENQRIFKKYKERGFSNKDITQEIINNIDLENVLKPSIEQFDGGYVMAGMTGHGDAFIVRDPAGIRPAYYFKDDEVVVVASERPAIQTAFKVHISSIKEITPGAALIIKKDGSVGEIKCREPEPRKSCSFERIYFSRGNDASIYKERKKLGELVIPKILESINHDIKNTVFSYIPNTSEVAFLGMIEALQKATFKEKIERIKGNGTASLEHLLDDDFLCQPRIEKIAVKDAKLRTFISQDTGRNDLVAHVYDVTYGLVRNGQDNLVVIDDSIVRGTTLEESIISMLDRLQPKKIIIVSSAPQIRYPDCYGIDMSKMGQFIAFRAAINLLKQNGKEDFIKQLYHDCKEELTKPVHEMENIVKRIYEPFTYEQISDEIAAIVKPKHIFSDVEVIYQTIEGLHEACPEHLGDWYFTGDYPTPGGNRVVLNSFVNYYEGGSGRAY